MAEIKSFRDLDLYKQALRSSRAVGAMVAEAWAWRRYEAAFINKLNEAQAETAETQAWLDHARMCDYIDQKTYEVHDQAWQHIGGKLERMIQRAATFSQPARS